MYGGARTAGCLEPPFHCQARRPNPRCFILSPMQLLKDQKAALIRQHSQPDDIKGLTQVLTTLAALTALWGVAVLNVSVSLWLSVAAVSLMCLLTLRVFALMHECG